MLEWEQLPQVDTSRLMMSALIGTVIGARIVHCAFYDPTYYLANQSKVFAIWEGGLASHGGVIGLIIGLGLATRNLPRCSLMMLLDRVTISAAFGGAIVRIANFANSEILGIPTEGNFGVVFDAVDQIARHPVQLYEAAAYFALTALLFMFYLRTNARSRIGMLTGVFMAGIFSARLLLEPFKVQQATYEAGYWASVGQSLSIPFVFIGLTLVARGFLRDKAICSETTRGQGSG